MAYINPHAVTPQEICHQTLMYGMIAFRLIEEDSVPMGRHTAVGLGDLPLGGAARRRLNVLLNT